MQKMMKHPKELSQDRIKEIQKAQDPMIRMMVKGITRARDAVANALINTLNEEIYTDE